MKRIRYAALAAIILTSLTACMIVPPRAEYLGPGIGVVAPYPFYQQPYYGDPGRPSHYHRDWDRR